MSLAALSLRQALSVWKDLDDAMYGRASHGNTAEIYAYRLMPYLPTVVAHGTKRGDDPQLRAAQIEAAGALVALCEIFEEERDARVTIDGAPVGMAFVGYAFDHRCKVRVERKDGAA